MASKRRMHLTATPTRSRKRAKLSNVTNTSNLPSQSENFKNSQRCSSYIDQLVPGNEACLENFDCSSMYCSEDFKHFSFTDSQLLPKKRDKVCSRPGGYFSCLPPEILHKVISSLGLVEIISLALTSHELGSYIRGYVYTAAGLSHILPLPPSSSVDFMSKIDFVSLGMRDMYFYHCIFKCL